MVISFQKELPDPSDHSGSLQSVRSDLFDHGLSF
jgi:hypothetical protein